MKRKEAVLAAAISLCLMSCEHQMQISNLPKIPFTDTGLSHPVSIGVVNRSTAGGTEGYVEAVGQGLHMQGNVPKVAYPYLSGHVVDVIVFVDVIPKYRGVGTNFFVDWPGFLIFTPAWHGYSYHADLLTRVELVSAHDKQPFGRFQWNHDYEFHQADTGRSWVEVGWLEWSLIPFIGGFFAIEYDTDQTDPFIRMAGPSYGNQIATRISQQLVNYKASKPEAQRTAPGGN